MGYDIVVLMNGTNDVKRVVLPFASFREDSIEVGLHKDDWKRLSAMEKFRNTMENILLGLGHFQDKTDCNKGTNSSEERMMFCKDPEQQSLTATSIDYGSTVSSAITSFDGGAATAKVDIEIPKALDLLNDNHVTTSDNGISGGISSGPIDNSSRQYYHNYQQQHQTQYNNNNNKYFPKPRRRSVILPTGDIEAMMPNVASIVSQKFAVFCTDIMEKQKQKVASQFSNSVFWLKPDDGTSRSGMKKYYNEYKKGRGEIIYNTMKEEEGVLLSLVSISKDECLKVEESMKEYHNKLPKKFRNHDKRDLFCGDRVHPSDRGYEFWGWYSGLEMAQFLQRVDNDQANF